MAPGLLDPQEKSPAVTSKGPVGPKEAFTSSPKTFNKKAEEEGTESQPPATHPRYLPIWVADTK